MNYLVKFMAVIFIIALTTRVITNRSQANTKCNNPAIDDSKQTTVVEISDSIADSTKNIAKYFDI